MQYYEIHTVDVRQGDCQFIAIREYGSNNIASLLLIDAGVRGRRLDDAVQNYWQRNFFPVKVNWLIISHWDSDHYAGIAGLQIFEQNCNLSAPTVRARPRWMEGFVYRQMDLGQVYQHLNLSFSCHAIDQYIQPFDNQDLDIALTPTNRSSIALLFHDSRAGFYYYTGGDLSEDEELGLADSTHPFNRINSFKLSHHGSRTSTPEEFLAAIVKPGPVGNETIAICSHGGRYSHPSQETLDRLINFRIKTILTNPIRGRSNEQRFIAFAGTGNLDGNIIQLPSQRGGYLTTAWMLASQQRNLSNAFRNYFSADGWVIIELLSQGLATERNELRPTSADKRIEKFLHYFDPAPAHTFEGDDTCLFPALPVQFPKGTMLDNGILHDSGSTLELSGDLKGIKLGGEVNDEGFAVLSKTAGSGEIAITDLIKLLSPGMAENLPGFIGSVFGKVEVDDFNLEHDFKTQTQTLIKVSTTLTKEIVISDEIRFKDPGIGFQTVYDLQGSLAAFFNARLSSTLEVGHKKFDIHLDFSTNKTWDLEISPNNFYLTDIPGIIPGFNESEIHNWASTLQLDTITIERVVVGVNFGETNKLVRSLMLGLGINIFQKYKLLLNLAYFPGEAMSIYGSMEDTIKVPELLQEFDLPSTVIDSFPDVAIDDFGFSANPGSKSYSIEANIDLVDADFQLDVGPLNISIESFGFQIEKSDTGSEISVSLKGKVDEVEVKIQGDYSTGDGFSYTAEISDLNTEKFIELFDVDLPSEVHAPEFENIIIRSNPASVSASLEAGFTVEILDKNLHFDISSLDFESGSGVSVGGEIDFFGLHTSFVLNTKGEIRISVSQFSFSDLLDMFIGKSALTSYFTFDLNNLEIVISKRNFQFNASVASLSIGEYLDISENELSFGIINRQLSFELESKKIEIRANDKVFKTAGGLSVNPKRLSFYGRSYDSFENVFGIEGLNFGQLFISLNQRLAPPGLGIGFMGNLAYKDTSGTIALYFSPQVPSDQLLAVSFTGINLGEVVSSIVGSDASEFIEILNTIGIEPIGLLNDAVPKPEGEKITDQVYEAIKTIDHNTKKEELVLKSHEEFSWIPDGSYLVENTKDFKQYRLYRKEVAGKKESQYSLSKYVLFYGCLSPLGLEMNGILFESGFKFSGNIRFLGVEQIVDIDAKPKEGLELYYEMKESIKLGDVLSLTRMDDHEKGPILSLSTYPDNLHFFFSAELIVFGGLLAFGADVRFMNNRFSLMVYRTVLGFRTSITAIGSIESLENANFGFQLSFTTNGFEGITREIADLLYAKADEINGAINDAARKLEDARRTVEEYQRNIDNVSHDIYDKQKYLSKLKKTRYPWYKAYKYVALGVKIAAVGVQIAGLLVYKGAQIVLAEAAIAVLRLAEEALKATGNLSEKVIKGVGDFIAAVGKGIDWLITIHKVQAGLLLTNAKKEFDFQFDFRLAGKNQSVNFSLSFDGDLKKALTDQIKRFFEGDFLDTTIADRLEEGNSVEKELDLIYGNINEEERREIERADNENIADQFKKYESDNKAYQEIFASENLVEGIKQAFGEFDPMNRTAAFLNEKSNTFYTNELDQNSIEDIIESLSISLDNIDKEAFFEKEVNQQSQDAITNLEKDLGDHLRDALGDDFRESDWEQLFAEVAEKTAKLKEIKLRTNEEREAEKNNIMKLMDYMNEISEHATQVKANRVEEESIPNLDSRINIIGHYENLINAEGIPSYLKFGYLINLGVGYAELGEEANSKRNFADSEKLARELFGEESEEFLDLQELIAKYWNE